MKTNVVSHKYLANPSLRVGIRSEQQSLGQEGLPRCGLVIGSLGLSLLLASQLTAQAQPVTVTQISAGAYHSLFVKSDGSLWGMGYNASGQLGLGTTVQETNTPQEIVTNDVGMVAAGYFHTLFEKGNAVWAMGANDFGQLGDTTTTDHYVPESIYTGNPYTTITGLGAGTSNSLFAIEVGIRSLSKYSYSLYGMGWNAPGELGDGTYNDSHSPEDSETISGNGAISSIASGLNQTLFIMPDSSLWAMGNDAYGQLGSPLFMTTNLPEMIEPGGVMGIAAGTEFSLFVKSDGTVWAMGQNQYGQFGDDSSGSGYLAPLPQLVFSNLVAAGAVAVAAGYGHSLVITSDGILWASGYNDDGQLGDGNTASIHYWYPVARNVVAAAAGEYHSLFIKSDGSLWGMGWNGSGQLGGHYGSLTNYLLPTEIVPAPAPAITGINLAGANVVVTWPTNQGGFYLTSTTNLALPSTAWNAVSPGPVIVNGQYTVTNPISASHQFYQLIDGDGAPAPSIVTTLSANEFNISVTTNSATLWSTINGTGTSASLYIEYELTTNYGATTPLLGYGITDSQTLGYGATGLSADTIYHFQAIAYTTNSVTNYGGDLTFQTQ